MPSRGSLLEVASRVSNALSSQSNVGRTLFELGSRMARTRRFESLRLQTKTGVHPRSESMVWDKHCQYERGWERHLGMKNGRPAIHGAITKVSDLQVHEVYQGAALVLEATPTRRSEINNAVFVSKEQADTHFHFILYRHRVSLRNVLKYLSDTSNGALPTSAFKVSVMTCDASGVVTQRLSICTHNRKALEGITLAANNLPYSQRRAGTERFCRLQPVGYQKESCNKWIESSTLQYTILLRGLSNPPSQTLSLAYRALRAQSVNYFNPMVFGGTQPLLALSEIHKGIKRGDLHLSLSMFMALSSRSGRLSRAQILVFQTLLDNPLGTAEVLSLPEVNALPAWFKQGLAMLLSAEDKVHQTELHNYFHRELPEDVRAPIKHSTSLLSWNATASTLSSFYSDNPSDRLALPCTGGGEATYSEGNSIAWGETDLRRPFTAPVMFEVDTELLPHVVIPIGVHSKEGSACNVGWAALATADPSGEADSWLSGRAPHAYRRLLIQPKGIECCVCYGVGSSEESRLMTDVAKLQSDSATKHSKHEGNVDRLSNRFSKKLHKLATITDTVSSATKHPQVHSLAMKFQLPPATDPSIVLASFADVTNDLGFVPEDNGMHIALTGLGSQEELQQPTLDNASKDNNTKNTNLQRSEPELHDHGGNLMRLRKRTVH